MSSRILSSRIRAYLWILDGDRILRVKTEQVLKLWVVQYMSSSLFRQMWILGETDQKAVLQPEISSLHRLICFCYWPFLDAHSLYHLPITVP